MPSTYAFTRTINTCLLPLVKNRHDVFEGPSLHPFWVFFRLILVCSSVQICGIPTPGILR